MTCPNCLEQKFTFSHIEGVIIAECLFCGHDIAWEKKGWKPKKYKERPLHHPKPVAEYEIRNGHRYLKIDGEFKLVELRRFYKGPNSNKTWLKVCVVGSKEYKNSYSVNGIL